MLREIKHGVPVCARPSQTRLKLMVMLLAVQ
jgi:hypothetical protein